MAQNWFNIFLPWVNIILTVFVIMIPVYLGQRIGYVAVKKQWTSGEGPIGSVVGASLGLLAFMLAFTFQIGSNKLDARKQLFLNELSEMRSIYHLSTLLPERQRTDARYALIQYVNSQVRFMKNPETFAKEIVEVKKAQNSLWKVCEALAKVSVSSEIYALFTASVNEMINIQNERMAVSIQFRIPKTILYSLYSTAFFSMLVLGFQFGVSGKSTHFIKIALAFVFASVVWVIIALDNPESQLININYTSLEQLQQQISNSP